MKTDSNERLFALLDKLQLLLLVLFGALAAFLAVRSLGFRIQHDLPMVLYPGWLFLDGQGVPYKDIFDVNMPGSFLLYGVIAKLFASDFALRVLDMLLFGSVAALAFSTFGAMSRRAVSFGVIAFALLYFGPNWWWLSMQREMFLLLMLLLAAKLALHVLPIRVLFGSFGIGLLAGCCLLIKPQSLIAFLALGVWIARLRKANWLGMTAGFALPLLATFAYLKASGAWPDFAEMLSGYLPLYAQIGGDLRVMEAGERFGVLLRGLLLVAGYWVFALLAVADGAFLFFRESKNREQVSLLLMLASALFLYPAFSGQFWLYHWLPFLFFACILLGVSMTRIAIGSQSGQAVHLILFAGSVLAVSYLFAKPAFLKAFLAEPPPKQGRVDEMVDFLRPRLLPGDKIQPLDWTGGAVHAMLILKAPMATRYMQDFYFYHHVSNPVIQGMRRDFISKLAAEPPRFMIQVYSDDKPWASGTDTTRSFEELDRLLVDRYAIVNEGNGYRIFEKKQE